MYTALTLDGPDATECLLVRAVRARPVPACCDGADARRAEVEAALREVPGRAAGRVAAWASRGTLALSDGRLRADDDATRRVAVDEARLLAAVALLQAGRADETDRLPRRVAPAARVRGRSTASPKSPKPRSRPARSRRSAGRARRRPPPPDPAAPPAGPAGCPGAATGPVRGPAPPRPSASASADAAGPALSADALADGRGRPGHGAQELSVGLLVALDGVAVDHQGGTHRQRAHVLAATEQAARLQIGIGAPGVSATSWSGDPCGVGRRGRQGRRREMAPRLCRRARTWHKGG